MHRSTISCELSRNVANQLSEGKVFCPEVAQQLTYLRHHDTPNHRRFPEALKAQTRQWLTQQKLSLEPIRSPRLSLPNCLVSLQPSSIHRPSTMIRLLPVIKKLPKPLRHIPTLPDPIPPKIKAWLRIVSGCSPILS